MNRLPIFFIYASVFLLTAIVHAEDDKQTDTKLLRYYYNGAWHESPSQTLDPEKDFYWDKDRKVKFPEGHIHRPNDGYVLKDGRWEVDRNIKTGKHQVGTFYYDGRWHDRPRAELYDLNVYWFMKDFKDFFARKDYSCKTVETEYTLFEEESARIHKLINNGAVEKLLDLPREQAGRPNFIYDCKERLMYVKARADLTAILMTLITSGPVFEAYTRKYENGMKCEAFSLIDPVFYENDVGKADIITAMNLTGALRLLNPESDAYKRSGAAFFVNQDLGTLVIVDTSEKLDNVRIYLDGMPYSPIKGKKRIGPGK